MGTEADEEENEFTSFNFAMDPAMGGAACERLDRSSSDTS